MKVFKKNFTAEQRRIYDDLYSQLEAKGAISDYVLDLLNDYMKMMENRDRLQVDIEKRGTLIEYNNGGGQGGFKKNDSLDQLNKVLDRMEKRLDFLGIKPSELMMGADDDEL